MGREASRVHGIRRMESLGEEDTNRERITSSSTCSGVFRVT